MALRKERLCLVYSGRDDTALRVVFLFTSWGLRCVAGHSLWYYTPFLPPNPGVILVSPFV